MKKIFILLACISVLFSCGDKDNGKDTPYVDTPQNGMYNEPLVNFGASKAEIKKQEKRAFLEENETGLMFQGNNYVIVYLFKSSKLTSSAAVLPLATDAKKLTSFLSSRYDILGEEDDMFFWQTKNEQMIIAVGVETTGIYVMYMPSSSLAPEKIQIFRSAELADEATVEQVKAAIRQQMQ